jgi:hypothetical protein
MPARLLQLLHLPEENASRRVLLQVKPRLSFFLKASHDLVGRVRVAFASCGYPKNTQAFYMVLMTIKFSRH